MLKIAGSDEDSGFSWFEYVPQIAKPDTVRIEWPINSPHNMLVIPADYARAIIAKEYARDPRDGEVEAYMTWAEENPGEMHGLGDLEAPVEAPVEAPAAPAAPEAPKAPVEAPVEAPAAPKAPVEAPVEAPAAPEAPKAPKTPVEHGDDLAVPVTAPMVGGEMTKPEDVANMDRETMMALAGNLKLEVADNISNKNLKKKLVNELNNGDNADTGE